MNAHDHEKPTTTKPKPPIEIQLVSIAIGFGNICKSSAFIWGVCAFLIGLIPHIFFESTWDSLGYVQAYQAIVDGSFLIPSTGGATDHVFSVHFWPLGLLIAPIFAMVPGYVILVAIQSALLASSIPAVKRLLALRNFSTATSTILLRFWMLNPFLWGIHMESREAFQYLTFCIPLFLWGQWAWEAQKPKLFLGIAICLLLLREDVAITVITWCIFLLIKDRRQKSVQLVLAMALIWFPFVIGVIMPHFNQRSYGLQGWGYEWAGTNMSQIIIHLLTNPISSCAHILTGGRIAAVLFWIVGMLGGPLLSPTWLIPALPQLGVTLLSDHRSINLPFFRYSAPILPFFLLSCFDAIKRYPRLAIIAKLIPFSLPIYMALIASRWVPDIQISTVKVLTCLDNNMPDQADFGLTSYRGISRLWKSDRTPSVIDESAVNDISRPLNKWIVVDKGRGA